MLNTSAKYICTPRTLENYRCHREKEREEDLGKLEKFCVTLWNVWTRKPMRDWEIKSPFNTSFAFTADHRSPRTERLSNGRNVRPMRKFNEARRRVATMQLRQLQRERDDGHRPRRGKISSRPLIAIITRSSSCISLARSVKLQTLWMRRERFNMENAACINYNIYFREFSLCSLISRDVAANKAITSWKKWRVLKIFPTSKVIRSKPSASIMRLINSF